MVKFTVYEGRDGWRWQLKAANGKIIADSGEAYSSEYNAVRAAKRTKELAPTAPIQRPNGVGLNEERMTGPGYASDPF